MLKPKTGGTGVERLRHLATRRLVIGGFHGPDDVKELPWFLVRRSRMVL